MDSPLTIVDQEMDSGLIKWISQTQGNCSYKPN